MTFAARLLDRRTYSELRRRVVRGALAPLRRLVDARLQQNVSAVGVQQILICRPNHRLGNLLLLTPLLDELERRLPGVTIDLVVAGDTAAELFAGYAGVGRIYSLSRKIVRHVPATARAIVQIRRMRYDWAIDPCLASQSSRLLAVAANPSHLLGFPRSDQSVSWEDLDPLHSLPQHAAKIPVYMLRRILGCDYENLRSAYPPLDLRLSAVERAEGQRALMTRVSMPADSHITPVVGLFVEATGAKRYPRDWWQRFVAELRSKRPMCVLVEILPPDGRPRLGSDLPTFSSPSPRKVAAVISNMTYFVSADCGVMHLASASGTPTLGLFLTSDMNKYQPYGHGSRALLTAGLSPETVAQSASEHIGELMASASGDLATPAR